jgi:hypothetical protein
MCVRGFKFVCGEQLNSDLLSSSLFFLSVCRSACYVYIQHIYTYIDWCATAHHLSQKNILSLSFSLHVVCVFMYVYAGSGESHLGTYSVVVPADAKPGDTLTIWYEDTHIVA